MSTGPRQRSELTVDERAALALAIGGDPGFPGRLEGVRRHLAALPAHRWGMPRVVSSETGRSTEVLDGGTWLPGTSLVRGDLAPFDAGVGVALVCRALEAWNEAPPDARHSILTTLELGVDPLGRVRIGAALTPRSRYPVMTHADVLGFLAREPSQERAEVLAWAEQLHLLLTGRFAFPAQKLDPSRPPFSRPDRALLGKLPAAPGETLRCALDPNPAMRPATTAGLLEHLAPFSATEAAVDQAVWERLRARSPELRERLKRRMLELSLDEEPLPRDMEERLFDSKADESAYEVLRDWMLSQGWERGAFAALPHTRPVGQVDFDNLTLSWKHGWVLGARVTYPEGLDRLRRLVKGSSFRFVQRVELPGTLELEPGLVTALVEAGLRNLRTVAAPGPRRQQLLDRLHTLPRFERWELVPRDLPAPPPTPDPDDEW